MDETKPSVLQRDQDLNFTEWMDPCNTDERAPLFCVCPAECNPEVALFPNAVLSQCMSLYEKLGWSHG